jgi:hypothetical protein
MGEEDKPKPPEKEDKEDKGKGEEVSKRMRVREPRIAWWIKEPKCCLCQMLAGAMGVKLECEGEADMGKAVSEKGRREKALEAGCGEEYRRQVMGGWRQCKWRKGVGYGGEAEFWMRFSEAGRQKLEELGAPDAMKNWPHKRYRVGGERMGKDGKSVELARKRVARRKAAKEKRERSGVRKEWG